MPPSRVELICAACLNDKAIRERLRVVGAVPERRWESAWDDRGNWR